MSESIVLGDSSVNYFSTVEDHFRVARGTPLFMLSSLDFALLDSWKNAGIPIEAVLRGIDVAFKEWRERPARGRHQMINSVAYCAQPIAAEAQRMADAAAITGKQSSPPFTIAEVRGFVVGNVCRLRETGQDEFAASLESLDLETLFADLEQLEQRLTAIEEKMIARLRANATDEALLEMRRALDRDLKPYREKMSADQITMLEKQFLERRLLESAGLPRLSLFYL